MRAIASASCSLVILERPLTPSLRARSYSSCLELPRTSTPPWVLAVPRRACLPSARSKRGKLMKLSQVMAGIALLAGASCCRPALAQRALGTDACTIGID